MKTVASTCPDRARHTAQRLVDLSKALHPQSAAVEESRTHRGAPVLGVFVPITAEWCDEFFSTVRKEIPSRVDDEGAAKILTALQYVRKARVRYDKGKHVLNPCKPTKAWERVVKVTAEVLCALDPAPDPAQFGADLHHVCVVAGLRVSWRDLFHQSLEDTLWRVELKAVRPVGAKLDWSRVPSWVTPSPKPPKEPKPPKASKLPKEPKTPKGLKPPVSMVSPHPRQFWTSMYDPDLGLNVWVYTPTANDRRLVKRIDAARQAMTASHQEASACSQQLTLRKETL
jgi:hypothetical protein